MDDFSLNSRQFRPVQNNVIRVQNAVIENIDRNNRTGLVTISYRPMGDFFMCPEEVVALNVSTDTFISDNSGNRLWLRDLQEGMVVDAEFSSVMTRSMPPQARAYRITVMEGSLSNQVTEGMVLDVDLNNRFLYTGNPDDIYSQIRFVITDSTAIRNRRGRRIRLEDLRVGDFVRVVHASFMTMSIPPQTTAYEVQVL
ncbi:MAG: hypothetical protein AAGU76_17780 [Sedimentibacter sp.]|uniref:hypothetical protein n=1 Tax=Sedimentibacter sp. TaxID=1960295 RepID=UPI0031582127